MRTLLIVTVDLFFVLKISLGISKNKNLGLGGMAKTEKEYHIKH